MRGGTREVRYQPVPRQTPRRLDPPRHGRWRFLIPPSHVQRRGAVELVAGALCELGAAVVGLEVLTDVDGEGRAVGVVVVTEVSRSSNCSTTTPFAPLTYSRTCLHATTGLSVARLAHSPCARIAGRDPQLPAGWLSKRVFAARARCDSTDVLQMDSHSDVSGTLGANRRDVGGGRMPQMSAGTLESHGPSGRRAAGAAIGVGLLGSGSAFSPASTACRMGSRSRPPGRPW